MPDCDILCEIMSFLLTKEEILLDLDKGIKARRDSNIYFEEGN